MALFDTAKTLSKPAPRKAKTIADDTLVLKGLEDFAAVDAVIKALKTVAETESGVIKDEALDIFIGQGIQFAKRPTNFKAIDGHATASIQLKNYASPLSVEAVEILEENSIPLRTVDEVVETFVINPAYASDTDIMAKLEKALGKLDLPEDLFLHQSQKKTLVDGDATFDAIFKLKTAKGAPDRKRIEQLLPLVSSLAIKPNTTESLEKALERVEDLILDVAAVA